MWGTCYKELDFSSFSVHTILCQVVKLSIIIFWMLCFDMKGRYTWYVLFVPVFSPVDVEEMLDFSIADSWDEGISDSLNTPSDQYGMVLCDNKWLSWGTHSRKWKPILQPWNNRIQSFFILGGGGMCTCYGFLIFCHTVTMVNVYINHEQSFR